jgi:putative inorganic carbon (HCO3(-)) transporter
LVQYPRERELIEASRRLRPDPTVIAGLLALLGLGLGTAVTGTGLVFVVGVIVLGMIWMVAVKPEIATLLVVFILYTNAVAVAVEFHGAPGIAVLGVPALLIAPLAHAVLVRRQPIILTPALPWIAAFLIAQLLSAFASAYTQSAADEVRAFAAEGLILYLLITNVVRTPGAVNRVVWVLIAAGGALGSLSVIQQVTGNAGAFLGFAQLPPESGFRTSGPIGDPNFYAQIMLILLPIGIVRTLTERSPFLRLAALICTAVIALAILLTYSRGAALGAVAVLIGLFFLRYVHVWHIPPIAVAVIVMIVAFPAYATRIATLEAVAGALSGEPRGTEADVSVQSRTTENLSALRGFIDHPIFGVGPGQFPRYYQAYANEIGNQVRLTEREAHNLYLGLAAETGILGFTTFMAVIGVTFVQLNRARRLASAARPELAHISASFMLALIGYLVTSLFLHLAFARYVWLTLALASAAAAVTLRELQPGRTGPSVLDVEVEHEYATVR